MGGALVWERPPCPSRCAHGCKVSSLACKPQHCIFPSTAADQRLYVSIAGGVLRPAYWGNRTIIAKGHGSCGSRISFPQVSTRDKNTTASTNSSLLVSDFLSGSNLMARPLSKPKAHASKGHPKSSGAMAILGHAFKSAGADLAATRGLGPKVSKAAKYSYLIGKEVLGLVSVIPYGAHAILTHRLLPLGEALQQDLVEGLTELGQQPGLEETQEMGAGRVGGSAIGASQGIGTAVDLNPREHSPQGRWLDYFTGGVNLSGKKEGRSKRAKRWFGQSVYSANVVRDLAYGEGERERLDVFMPSSTDSVIGQAPEPGRPVVLFVHGGVWSSGEKWQYSPLGARLAHEGCVVAVMSYDLFPAVLAIEQSEQVSRALDWVFRNISKYGGDPSRVSLVGHSSGAHISSLAVYRRAQRILAARQKPGGLTDVSLRQPRVFVGMAGVYDIRQHLKFEQWRGVAVLSCMTPANGGLEGFAEVSAVRLYGLLGAHAKSGADAGGFEGGPFLGEESEASRIVSGEAEAKGSARKRPWKEWPFSTVADPALLNGGLLEAEDGVTHGAEADQGVAAGIASGPESAERTKGVGKEAAAGEGEQSTSVGDLLPRIVLQSTPGDTTVPIDTTVAFARCLEAIGCRVKNLVYDSLAHPDFVIWPRTFDGEEALGPHTRDLLRVIKTT